MNKHTVPIEIRFKDIDMNHHVNNAVYFTYMEQARAAVLIEEMFEKLDKGSQMLVQEASCKYKRPIILTDKLVCEVSFAPLRQTSFDIFYLFRNEDSGQVYAEGTTRMVMFNEHSGRPIAIPEWISENYL